MKIKTGLMIIATGSLVMACSNNAKNTQVAEVKTSELGDYKCIPFQDEKHQAAAQAIPGRLQNEFYDTMDVSNAQKMSEVEGGLCYHDTDALNNGSGVLNKSGTYLAEFRRYEGPDTSYTKLNNADVAVDDSEFNLVKPEADSLYLGWISPGEWVNYTVDVKETGIYSLTVMYTSKSGGYISFDSNGLDISGKLEIPSTFAEADPVEWRQAHHWNKISNLGKLQLQKGKQVLTLHFIDQPVMNFDYMDFIKIQ